MTGTQAIAALAGWTSQQGGLVTAAQADAVGVTRFALHSLARAGVLDRIRHGVYKLTGAPWSPHDDVRAVWLQSEPGPLAPEQRQAAVSHQTAAEVYGFGVLVAPAIQVTLPAPRRTTMQGVRWYAAAVAETDVEWVDDMRVTRPARIIADLFADGYGDLAHLGSVAADARRAHRLAWADLVAACAPFAAQYGLAAGDGEALTAAMLDSYGTTDAELAA
ncbi:MAG: type IV toxin-antitoxin system AbiEi family antitoxin domain-containing protein [Natronosporangium sp.]